MASLKSLAKDTAIYGMSSIVGRFLNYLLFPLYTHVFAAASGGNGVITNMYSYTALLFVILTFGMETTLFRFINRDDVEDPKKVYTTVLAIVGGVGLLFFALVLAFLPGPSAPGLRVDDGRSGGSRRFSGSAFLLSSLSAPTGEVCRAQT